MSLFIAASRRYEALLCLRPKPNLVIREVILFISGNEGCGKSRSLKKKDEQVISNEYYSVVKVTNKMLEQVHVDVKFCKQMA